MGGDVHLAVAKALIAIVACAYLLRERSGSKRGRRTPALVGVLAVAAFAAYFHFGDLPFKGFFHRWEMFHYYLGAKYSNELGYKGLYRCVAVADAETGARESVLRRRMRDLDTDALVPAASALDALELCTARFSPARWSEFRHDVVWFREAAASDTWWEEMQQDHGYNAPPLFTLVARPLTAIAPLSAGALFGLASLDLVLMAGTVLVLGWAFGSRIAWLTVIVWGTQAASEFYWTGGAFLRQDWLFLSVLALGLARRKKPFWGGAALAAAGCLRAFPLLFFAGPLVLVVASWVRRRTVPTAHRRFLLGGALALCLLAGTSFAAVGADGYRDFGARLELRASGPVANHMGLRTLFGASPATRLERTADPRALDPSAAWAAARTQRLRSLLPLYVLALLGFFAFWLRAVWRVRTLFVVLGLGVALVPMFAEPSSYYYSFVLLAVPLARAVPSLAVALVGLSGASQLVALRFAWIDDRFAALALLYVAFSLALVAAFSRRFGRVLGPRASSALSARRGEA